MAPKKINIEVVYAAFLSQKLIKLTVDEGCSVQHAITQSGILELFPEIDLTQQAIGIFSKKTTLNSLPQEGDRIELYRKLTLDPKQRRRLKAKHSVNKS